MYLRRFTQLSLGSTAAFLPTTAFALSNFANGLGNPTPGAGGTLWEFIYLLIDIIQWVALPVLAACIVYAGFQLVSAGGDETKVTSGKRWLVSSLIGVVIILGAHVIAGVVCGTAKLFDDTIVCPA
ncbi:MAG: hypothetical protein A3C93_05730 [Candidatus Lloydbacteria bacterium RIFCSPHIGHO2_02_FULL_54_17]|uniref:TrbC/VIRB2 family protein n=1 Tax=Candidatus Lloydbacteria bacterium RIFCSPHIGHO2_02_FULL_54_17 TaxID=1798664 RepID=A0A1G2DAY2_9BACT|nr:MAG: hypothetical protein A2762_03200 [Candidatus Lloydbacteria bacterium RIFCSPHIGHO2_01_FULL_54_11]OGZ10784.1 MAG: hypothetical protein A3C93_05730 [Candidatus Lloydbacteria bacterium RIFCSPHIGHO2_02_FULL_54_17]OGZ13085.1 MAG: hypothetical protein A2948_03710 [Candidatus Lloydbacteria bacterium RIFCSPLOWO2_01_FULL_54_18]OGZ16532.1 MAG: hypothetical protein A3H76_04570 [Candidatus Lloydbacteria bacterium RIFCSPLOWO2_02_FULL_54_12]